MSSPRQLCPKCGRPNATDAAQCAHCSAPLEVVCPRCGTRRPWYVARCPRCDARAADEAAFSELFRQRPARRILGRYSVSETLSAGRVSAVYRVTDSTQPGSVYALKELSPIALFRPDERRDLESRFHAQLRQWRRVTHPAVAHIVDAFTERDRYYVLMEYVSGRSIRDVITDRRTRISAALAANWGAQLCDLLHHLHDLEPPLYAPFLAPAHVMITPFGAVKLVDLGLTYPFHPAGDYGPHGSTQGYSAPELERTGPNAKTDQFALGRLLYALLVGRLLERGLPRNLPLQRAVPDISATLARAIARAAHRDPARRYDGIGDLRRALWDDAQPPLEPVEGWEQASRLSAAPSDRRRRAPDDGSSMADWGFEPDPRYGRHTRRPAAPMSEHRKPQESQPLTPEPARLTIRPQHLRLDDLHPDEARRIVLSLHNVGSVPVEGRLVSRVQWLRAPAKTFRLPAHREAKAIIRVSAEHLGRGQTTEPQALLVDTNAGQQWIAVTAEVPVGPVLALSPEALDFGEVEGAGQRSMVLTVRNGGSGVLSGALHSQVDWLRTDRQEFRCMPGEQVDVQVSLLPDRLPDGPQCAADALLVDSDAGQRRIEVRAWVRRPHMEIEPTQLRYGDLVAGEIQRLPIRVRNVGDGPLTGRAQSLVAWLQVQPEEFSCGPGGLVELAAIADTVGLGEGPVSLPEAVHIQSNAGAVTLGVHVRVLAPRLALSTTHLGFGELTPGGTAQRFVTVRNDGSAALHATLEPLVEWARPAVNEIEVPPGGAADVAISADGSRVVHAAEIVEQPIVRVSAGNVMRDITATLSVLRPALRVEPSELDFGFADPAAPVTRTLQITNKGTGRLAWHAISDAAWVEVRPESGVCGPGETEEVHLTAYALALEEQTEAAEGTLAINSDGGRAKVPMRLAVANPHLACDTTFLDLGESVNYESVSASLRVFNYGLGRLTGSVRADQTWLVVSRASFECDTGRSVEIGVSTDMAEFPEGSSYGSGTLRLESNGGDAEVEVGVTVLLEPRVRAVDAVRLSPTPDRQAEAQGRVVLSNDGLAPAHVELVPSAPQMVLSRSFCDIKPGKRVRVGVRWEGAPPEPASELTIEVRVHDGTEFGVPVILEERESPEGDASEAT